MSDVVPFRQRTYEAKLFEVPIGDGFKIAGTLDGYIDFAVPPHGTYQLTLDEARLMLVALSGAIEDVTANCLYDRDALLEPPHL